MKQATVMAILAVAVTVFGLATGWFAARQKSGSASHGDEHGGHDEEAANGHEGHDHGPTKPKLSPQAIKNLGITVVEVESVTYWIKQEVPAIVAETQTSQQPLHAPIGGRVSEICVQPGAILPVGAVVLTLIREALPRPTLDLTDQILKPANEEFHHAVGELRKARRALDLLKTELERIRKFTESGTQDGLPILPRKNVIDLRYDIARGEMDLQNAENELRRHGATDEQVREIEAGKAVPMLDQQVWKQALQQNGLWTPQSESLYAALPSEMHERAWTVAAIGELTAAGLPLADLTNWMKNQAEAATHFLEIAGLLQQGQSLAAVRAMHAANGLEQVVRIEAPAVKDVPDWDLASLGVKPGQKVEAGQVVATLANPRELQLRAEPAGMETTALLKNLEQGAEIQAHALVAGSGPDLNGMKLAYVTSDTDGHGAVAILFAQNEALAVKDHPSIGRTRTWKLRAGLRYVLEVPTEKLDNVFVLPATAVTDDGPDKVVFIEDGHSYRSVKVVVRHQDHSVAVLDGKYSDFAPGDSVVTLGAFGLGLALKAGSDAIDPHAGHQH